MKNSKIYLSLVAFLLFSHLSYSQSETHKSDTLWSVKFDTITKKIHSLETSIPGLNGKVTNSVTGVPLNEFIRAVSISSGVNISIDPRLNYLLVNNFDNAKVSDVLLFLCDQYKFDMTSVGDIIVIKQINKPLLQNKFYVNFDPIDSLLSVNVDDIELGLVAQKIIDQTRKNVIPSSELFSQKIRAYIKNMPLESALDKIAYSNNLVLKTTEDGVFLFEKPAAPKIENPLAKKDNAPIFSKTEKEGSYKLVVNQFGKDSLFVFADNAPILEVLKEVSIKSGNNYIMTSIPKGDVSLQINGAKYQDILRTLLNGTDQTFKKKGSIYIIGNLKNTNLMSQDLVQLQYRTVDSIINIIPKDLIGDIDTKIFREQNSIMLSGPADKIAEAEKFIQRIDRLVPVISIEVMIIHYNTSITVSTGITAGIGPAPTPPTTGKVFPSIDLNISSQAINDLINRFNGFGWAKIGRVTPNFYAQLKAMENEGILNIRSTPILSTLNGHETKLSIGRTEYYLEEQFNIIGTQNPQSTKIDTYKPVNAELAVTITPVVSGDDQITLEVEVDQSDFTERISTNAPPGKVTRTFKSQIRVKNEEMILLGGLDENRFNKTNTGTPILSRIPILKWIFSAKTDEKSKSKLNIFIKPTIID